MNVEGDPKVRAAGHDTGDPTAAPSTPSDAEVVRADLGKLEAWAADGDGWAQEAGDTVDHALDALDRILADLTSARMQALAVAAPMVDDARREVERLKQERDEAIRKMKDAYIAVEKQSQRMAELEGALRAVEQSLDGPVTDAQVLGIRSIARAALADTEPVMGITSDMTDEEQQRIAATLPPAVVPEERITDSTTDTSRLADTAGGERDEQAG